MNPFLYLRSCTRFALALGLLLYGPLGLGAPAKPPHPTRPASTPARVARPSTLDPVAYYPFTGNANDESGNGLNGTPNGATLTTDRFGNANRAMHFDGNDNITFTGVPTTQTNNWTITTWVKLANLTQQEGVFVFNGYDDTSAGDGYSVLCKNGGPFGSQLFGLAGSVSYFNSGYTFSSTNTWYFVVMARSAGVTKFYVNGVQTSQTSTDTPRTPTGFFIGSGANSRYFSGDLDEVRVYDRAISENEILNLFTGDQVYVNDESPTGDVYTTAPGDDASGNGSPAAPFRSIAKAVSVASAGATIFVDAGEYLGCDLTKPLTIKGPNAGIDPNTGTRVAEATVSQQAFNIYASFRPFTDDLTLDGLRITGGITTITAYNVSFRFDSETVGNNVTIKNLIFDNANTFGVIDVQKGGNPPPANRISNWTITHNRVNGNIALRTINGLTISDNYVVGTIYVDLAGQVAITNNIVRGAYDAFFRTYSTGIVGGEYGANVSDLTISGNDIRNCGSNGAIFLQGDNTGAIRVMNNLITNSNRALYIRNGDLMNRDYLVTNNNLAGNSAGLVNDAGGTLNAPCNWYGTAPPSASYFGGSVDYSTFLSTGTDHEPATPGFQPVPNSCGCAIAVSLTGGGPLCAGGTRQLSGTAGETQTWSSGNPSIATVSNTGLVTGLAAGTVTISYTATDGSGCSGTATLELTVNATPLAPGVSGTLSFCTGGSTTLTASGCTGSYLWSPGGQTTAAITVTTGGEYAVTCSENGCSSPATTRTVTVNPIPTAPTVSGRLSICAGGTFLDPSGSTFLTASGCTGSYLWSPGGQTSSSIIVTAGGEYSVTCTENGCTSPATTRTVTVNPLPTPVIQAFGPLTFCQGGFVGLGTTETFSSYYWKKGDDGLSGNSSIAVGESGSYTVSVRDVNGCNGTSAPVIVTVNPIPAAPSVSGTPSVCTGSSTTLTASGCTGSYLWSPGGQTTAALTVSAAGEYSVTCTQNNCTSPATARTVTVNPLPTPSISGGPLSFCAGGSVTLSTGSFSSYIWKKDGNQVGTSPTFSATTSGSYTVTVTDANGCVGTSSPVTVTVNPLPTPTISGGPLSFCPGGSVTLSTGSFTSYIWKKGSDPVSTDPTYSANASGSYTVTVTDANGCVGTSAPVVVTVNPIPAAPTVNGATNFCAGSSTTLTASGCMGSYLWSPGGQTTAAITVTTAGGYSVTCTENGCSSTATSRTVTVNPLPTPTISGTPLTFCAGGSVTLSTGSFTSYVWKKDGNQVGTAANYSANSSGSYTVSVTDGNGCTGTSAPVVVTVNPLPVVSFSGLAASYLLSDGAATLTGSPGGTFGGPGVSGNTFTPSAAGLGTHTITYQYTDGNTCANTASRNTTVTDGVVYAARPGVSGVPVCAGQTLTLTFSTVSPTTATFSAQLSDPNGSFATFTPLGPVAPGTTTLRIPGDVPSGSNYRIRVLSSAPVVTSLPSDPFRINGLGFSSTPTVSQVPVCAGATFKVSFTLNANCGYLPGNVFSVDLSNASGSFASATSLGSVAPGINSVDIPFGTPAGTGYRVQIRSSSPAQVSAPSSAFAINVPGYATTPTVTGDNKCPGETVRLTFSVGCAFAPGNTFTAQLSNATGTFAASPVSLGLVTPGSLNNVVIPAGTPVGIGYKIRVVASNPAVTSAVSATFRVKACNTREAAPEVTGLRVSVSPNPSPEGRLHLSVSGAEGQVLRLELLYGNGQRVRQQTIEKAGEEEILDWDIARQPAGLYLLRVSAGREVKTLKVLR